MASSPNKNNSNNHFCSIEVTSFNLHSKTVSLVAGIIHPVLLELFLRKYFNTAIINYNSIIRDIKLIVRIHLPPIPDI